MSERRQHFRRRTLLDGRLEIDKLNGWVLGCSVRNLNEGGARVTIPDGIVVPQHVGLAVSGHPRRAARLVWYREGQAGFALVEARKDAQADTADEAAAPLRGAEPADAASADRLAARMAAITVGHPRGHFTRP